MLNLQIHEFTTGQLKERLKYNRIGNGQIAFHKTQQLIEQINNYACMSHTVGELFKTLNIMQVVTAQKTSHVTQLSEIKRILKYNAAIQQKMAEIPYYPTCVECIMFEKSEMSSFT